MNQESSMSKNPGSVLPLVLPLVPPLAPPPVVPPIVLSM